MININAIRARKDRNIIPIEPEVLQKSRAKFSEMNPVQKEELMRSISWFFIPDNIKKKTREEIQAKMKTLDRIAIFLAFFGIITNIISSALYIEFQKEPNIAKGNVLYILN